MNTHKYPRTMNEAFNRTVEYGCAVERPYPRSFWTRLLTFVIVCMWLTTAVLMFGALQYIFRGAA